jgi:hypothetical protein
LRKTGQFQKNGGNKTRNPNNRQGNSSSGQSNQNSNSRNSSSRQSNQNSNSSSRNSGAGGNAGSRKKGIHPWVSSGPSSSQALTSHISMVSNKSSSEGGNGNNRNKPQGQKRRNSSHQQRDNGNNGRPRNHQNQHDKAKRNNNAPSAAKTVSSGSEQKGSEQKLTGNLDAFSLFCAYHLGIGPNKEYKASNINEVARRFGQDQGVVKQALKECNMDSAALLDKDFDMALAQLDIQVAPEGIDKMELAKSIYEDFLEAPNVKRDWKKIIEEDRKENRKIFG